MKLFYSLNSPYARKARIIIHELKLGPRVEETIVSLPGRCKIPQRVNPLGKDSGAAAGRRLTVIYDSPVICEYLDEFGEGKFFPRASLFKAAEGRWRALTLQALGDGLGRRGGAAQSGTAPGRRQAQSAEMHSAPDGRDRSGLLAVAMTAPRREISRRISHDRRNRDCLRHRLSRSAGAERWLARSLSAIGGMVGGVFEFARRPSDSVRD